MAKSLILCNTTIVNSRSFLQSPSYHSIDSTAENLTLNQYDTNKGSHIVGSKLNQNLTIPNHPSNFRYGLSLHEFDSLSSPVGPENLLKGNRKHALIKASHCTVPNSSSHILSEVQLVINQNSESANRSAGSSESKCSGLGESVHDEGRKSGAAVTPSDLVTLINNQESLLLLDCRTFMAFNANHVNGALNVSCSDRITKKRLGDGKVKVLDLVSGQEEKEMYRRLEADAEIVLYDESTREIESLPETSSLRLLSKCLLKHGKHPKFLQGGLQAFQECYSFMCSHPDSTAGVPLLYSPTSPEINCQIDTAVASEILPYLFIGNQRDAENKERLIELGVTHILNVTSHLPLHFENDGITYKRLPATDSGSQNLKQYFTEAISFIECARQSNGKVLVHCQAGVSRSPTIVAAYLIATSYKSLTDAFTVIRDRRPIVAPNINFMGQLLEFEQRSVPSSGLCSPATGQKHLI